MSKCKHPYYHYVNGVLRCTECGQRSGRVGYSDSVPEYPEKETEKETENPESKKAEPQEQSITEMPEVVDNKYLCPIHGIIHIADKRTGKKCLKNISKILADSEKEAETKAAEKPEDKVGEKPEDKSVKKIMEPESKRLSDKPPKNKQKKK